jgi:hypothetical protein
MRDIFFKYTDKYFSYANFCILNFSKGTKKSCHQQDPFQNINPNITLEIKSFDVKIVRNKVKLIFSNIYLIKGYNNQILYNL